MYSKQNDARKSTTTEYATIGTLIRLLIYRQGLPHQTHTQSPMKRNKEKGSRDFPLFRRQSAGRWWRSCPVGTCSPLARVLCLHVSSAHTHRPQTAPLVLLISFSPDTDSNLRPWGSFPLSCFCLSSHTHGPRSQHPPDSNLSRGVAFTLSLTNSLALRPLLGRRILSPPIGAKTRLLPSSP